MEEETNLCEISIHQTYFRLAGLSLLTKNIIDLNHAWHELSSFILRQLNEFIFTTWSV